MPKTERVKSLKNSGVKKVFDDTKWRRLCSIDNCEKQSRKHGLCARHLTENKSWPQTTTIFAVSNQTSVLSTTDVLMNITSHNSTESIVIDENHTEQNIFPEYPNIQRTTMETHSTSRSVALHSASEQSMHPSNIVYTDQMNICNSSITISTETDDDRNKSMHTKLCKYGAASDNSFRCRDLGTYTCSHCQILYCLSHGNQHQADLKEDIKHLLNEAQDLSGEILSLDITSNKENCVKQYKQIIEIMRTTIEKKYEEFQMEIDRLHKHIQQNKHHWKTSLMNRLEMKVGCVLIEQLEKYEVDGHEINKARDELNHVKNQCYLVNDQPLIFVSNEENNQVDSNTSQLVFPSLIKDGLTSIERFCMQNTSEVTDHVDQQQIHLEENMTSKQPDDSDIVCTTENYTKNNKNNKTRTIHQRVNTTTENSPKMNTHTCQAAVNIISPVCDNTFPSMDLTLMGSTDENRVLHSHYQLNQINKDLEGNGERLNLSEKSLEIDQTAVPKNYLDLIMSYDNNGFMYYEAGDCSIALSFYEKAHGIREKTLPSDHPDLAMSYCNIGWVYSRMGDYSKALSFHEKALGISQKTFNSNHPDLATFHCNIGWVYSRMGDYSKALAFHEQALHIREITLLSNHPDLATSYCNIGWVYSRMGDYSKALTFHEKALRIREKTLPSDHSDLATSYNNMGSVYEDMGDYSKALSFHDKALGIREKVLPPNHCNLATSYNNIGLAYDNMGDYSKALSFQEKALQIYQTTLSPNHPHLATSYCNIGWVYSRMGDYSRALLFHEKDLEISQKTLPSNHPDLATSYNNIGWVYSRMGDYSKALAFHDKALGIREKTLSPSHRDLATSYNNIGLVHDGMNNYLTAFWFYRRAVCTGQGSLPSNHPDLQQWQKNVGLIETKLKKR